MVKNVMLGGTVGGELATIKDVAEIAWGFAGFSTNALNGQSMIVSHGTAEWSSGVRGPGRMA